MTDLVPVSDDLDATPPPAVAFVDQIRHLVMVGDVERRKLAEAGDVEGLAWGLVRLKQVRQLLSDLLTEVEADVFALMPEKKRTVIGVGTRRSPGARRAGSGPELSRAARLVAVHQRQSPTAGDTVKRSPLTRTSGLRRSRPMRTRSGRPSIASRRARADVSTRSGGWCEARIAGFCEGRASQMHHRVRRSQGGTDSPAILVDLCRACHHDAIHQHPDWASRHGWLIRSGEVPWGPVVGCGLDCVVDHREVG